MTVEFQYFEDCPNWQQTYERLVQVMAGRDDIVLTMTEVSSPEEAHAVQFRGSPSVLIEGIDPFADSWQLAAGTLACRVYDTSDGSPTIEELQAALRHQ